ncbi:NAD(P)H-binding protein [Novosphingobium sp.]|uniref:NAD(P)H-binding protein n=1 Tax=Novosphingobium sp. TaxID=1874826 RepID=UPI00261B6F2D|nr:NAD(P)H-binding protein [Novosphingobium sp.]
MSRPTRICLVGASGLIGTALIAACVGRTDIRLVAVARRELTLPRGATMEVLLAEPEHWADAIAAARPDVVVCALGTTRAKVGGDEAAFRAVDQDLVLACAAWAVEAGARQFIVVSSIGADPHARNFYLRVKGETEAALARTGQARLDILQPSLLLGPRAERRPAEAVGRALAFLGPLLLHGGARRFRPIHGSTLAEVILALSHQKARGRFVHDHDGMLRVLRRHAFERSLGAGEAVD